MQYEILNDIDTRNGNTIYVLKVINTLNQSDFISLSKQIKDIGGYYSKFKKGFIFDYEPKKIIEEHFGKNIKPSFDIDKIKSISIVDFCEKNGIELSHSRDYAKLVTNDSCVIYKSKNSFIWNSKGINGDIVNFVSAYYSISLSEALKKLNDINTIEFIPFKHPQMQIKKNPDFKQLKYDKSNHVRNVFAYLNKTRCIDNKIINEFVNKDLLKQDNFNNCVFKTFDENKNLIGLYFNGTGKLHYQKIDENSSNLGFIFKVDSNPKEIKFFESPIDLMSYYNLFPEKCKNTILISMQGLKHETIIENILKNQIYNISICVDNDQAGQKFIQNLSNHLIKTGENINYKIETPVLKDWNDDLKDLVKKNLDNEINFLLTSIDKQYEKIFESPENFIEYVNFKSQFYEYSFKNQLLIKAQDHNPLFVLSEKDLKEKGLKLLPNAEPIKIFVPNTITFFKNSKGNIVKISFATKEEKEKIKNGLIKIYKSTVFGVGNVYSIANSNLPKEDYPKLLQAKNIKFENIDTKKTLENFKNAIKKNGIKIIEENLTSHETILGVKGFTDTEKYIVLNKFDNDIGKISTLAHEYAHVKLHNKTNISREKELKSDNIIEIEAETSAYLSLKENGIDSSERFISYIKSHKNFIDNSDFKENKTYFKMLDRIDKTSKELKEVIEKSIVIKKEIAVEMRCSFNG